MTDLVVASLEAWDGVWRRNQHLVAGMLRTNPDLRVLFAEPAADPSYEVLSKHLPKWGRGLRTMPLSGAEGRLWVFQPTKFLPRRVDSRTDQRLAAQVVAAANRLGFCEPVLWVNDPSAASVLRATGWASLYDITDDWLLAERTRSEHERLVRDEAYLMRACAEVVVCSQNLVSSKSQIRPVTLIHNAVEVAQYRVPASRPDDLPHGPTAVYLGTVHRDRVDVDLCAATAEALKGKGTVVLVGPAPLAPGDLRRLSAAGVAVLGPRDRDQVPGYLQWADVLLVPHVLTPFTESLDPIKLYEYQVVGRPVVSTPVAGFRDADDERITVADARDFPAAVASALATAWPFPERADGLVPTWADRVGQMAEVIERVRRAARPQ